jgi:prepilin-type N-terminal cleavage/methylation domain-containing protein
LVLQEELRLELLEPQGVHVYKSGFTITELLVALLLLGVLITVAGGFVLPLNLTRDSGFESRATAAAQSYLELLKSKWLIDTEYAALTLPVVCKNSSVATNCDLKIPDDWTLGINTTVLTAWTATEPLRLVVVEIKLSSGKLISFRTLVARP